MSTSVVTAPSSYALSSLNSGPKASATAHVSEASHETPHTQRPLAASIGQSLPLYLYTADPDTWGGSDVLSPCSSTASLNFLEVPDVDIKSVQHDDDEDAHMIVRAMCTPDGDACVKQQPASGFASLASVPSAAFAKSAAAEAFCSSPDSASTVGTLDCLLQALWDDSSDQGLFRYDVTACPTRVVAGPSGWLAQLNEGRAGKKRPTELRSVSVLQPFDAAKFHFGKAQLREALLQFEPAGSGLGGAAGAGVWAAGSQHGEQVVESAPLSTDPTLVLINVSPIDYGHVLLVPHALACLPQQVNAELLGTALAFAAEVNNPHFRLGYNSLGAYATINHLHFQGYYQQHAFPCERAAAAPVHGLKRKRCAVSVCSLTDYPVRGWVLSVPGSAASQQQALSQRQEMADLLGEVCDHLQRCDQPFNLLITNQGTKVFIWPQCYAERQAAGQVPEELLECGVNPAAFEVGGHLVLKRAADYDAATDGWARKLLAAVSLPEARFAALTQACFGARASCNT